MSREAVTHRLRELAASSASGRTPAVAMTRDAITRRLRSLAELSSLCRRLDATRGARAERPPDE